MAVCVISSKMKWPTGHCCCNSVTHKPFVAASQTVIVKTECGLNRVKKIFLTCLFDSSQVYIVVRQLQNKAVLVLKAHHAQQFLKVGHTLLTHM